VPTTTIESTLRDAAAQRRVAKQLSFWWRRRGVHINHVLTLFRPAGIVGLYSGPFPLTGPYALVTCVLAATREPGFRQDYAFAVRDALAPDIAADQVFVAFQPTDPDDHFGPHTPDWSAGTHPREAAR
jgi:hypothetical protein